MAKTRLSPASVPLPMDNDGASQSHDSDYDEDTSIISCNDEDDDDSYTDQVSGCDESTLVIDLSTPTMMRTRQYDTDAIEGNFFLPQELNLVESSPQFTLKSPIDLSQRTSPESIFSQAPSLSNSAVFLHNGSPSTIAPADMHYALASITSPGTDYSPKMSYAFDLNFDNQGTLFQDFSPMKGDMSQFIDYSPEKNTGSTLPRSIQKNRLSRVSLGAPSKSPKNRRSLVPNIFSTPKHSTPHRSGRGSTPSPSRLPRSAKKDEDINLNMRKLRLSPSPGPERSAKRIRSRSKSPVKNTPASATYPTLNRLCPDLIVAPRCSEINSRQEGRRRRETLEFRQFSREMRDFSAINIEALPLVNSAVKTGLQGLVEELEEVSIQTVKSATISSSQSSALPAQGARRKSMTAVIVPSHDKSESVGVEQVTTDANEEHKNIATLAEKLRIMEAELAIVKAQLVTSQQAHEQSLEELKAERVARERAQGVIQFMTAETKFLLQDATHSAVTKAAQASVQHEHHEVASRYTHTEEDAVSSTSGRSNRSVHSNDVRTRNPPSVTRSTRPGYTAPTKTREPYQRPNTTMGTYGTTSSSRPASRQAFNNSTSSTRSANVTSKVLVSSNIHNIVNQQSTGASLLAKKKSRPNLSENVKPSTTKTQQTGGAIRAVPKDRNLDGGLYGKR